MKTQETYNGKYSVFGLALSEHSEKFAAKRDLKFKIDILKNRLKSTDYKAIKYAEGELTAEEYVETLAQRRAWRAEINALEAEIKAIKEGANEN